MKISTKIVSGYGILIVLMAGLLTQQVISIHRMQSINRGLYLVKFQNAKNVLALMRDLDYVQEFSEKTFALGDPDYTAELNEYRRTYGTALGDLKTILPREMPEIQRLTEAWQTFETNLAAHLTELEPRPLSEFPADLAEQLDQLREFNLSLYQATLRSIDGDVEKAQQVGEQTGVISWVVALIALLLSAVVSFFIVQSISGPLKQLTQGTRAIAEGKFYYRLDTSKKDEFSQLARDFNTMTHRLNELDQMKKDFVSHVSHELKAPLASMQETIQIMLDEVPGPLSDKQRRLLELNSQSGRRLAAMISNLLDLSRMEAGVMQYELRSNDLTALVQSAVAEIGPKAGDKKIRIEVDSPEAPLMAECDGDRIMQVIRNLVANALQFSPRGSAVRVRLSAPPEPPADMPGTLRQAVEENQENRGFALVTVSDSGPGVPEDQRENIFVKFHQVKRGKKIQGQGVGLGLAISRTIVRAHRGAIWVDDNPGGGCVFSFLLPRGSDTSEVTYRDSSPL